MEAYPITEWAKRNGIEGLRATAAAVEIPYDVYRQLCRGLTGCSPDRAFDVERITEERTPGDGVRADELLRWHRRWNRRGETRRSAAHGEP